MEFARTELLFGDNLAKVRDKVILVIGLGGVGSYVVESLSRMGVKHLILVDGDTIDITNINRQLYALHSTIGKPKVIVAKERILDISSEIEVDTIYRMLTCEDIKPLIKKCDYVVDACDTIPIKKEIIRSCLQEKIPFIIATGTGNKWNPSLFQVSDIRKTSVDPICRILRKMVHDEHIKGKIPVVWSTEVPCHHDKVISSCSFTPSVAGLLCTSYIVHDIIGEVNE